MLKGDILKLIADYKALDDNTFWDYFMRRLESDKVRIAVDNVVIKSLPFEEMKFNSGRYHGINYATVLPEELIRDLKEDLENLEANR